MPRNSSHRPEPLTASGSVLLGFNQLSLLHGLYDRPDGRAESSADLVRAAIPYMRLFRDPNWSSLEKATLSLHPAWVEKGRRGRRNTWTLTPRGRAIVERGVAACLRGEGQYEGLAPWRERSKAKWRQECLDARIEAMERDDDGRELLARLECAMFAWSCFNRPTGYCSGLSYEGRKRALRGFQERYVLHHGRMPDGIHDVGNNPQHPSHVDFDALIGPLPSWRTEALLENTGRHIIVRAAPGFDVERLRELARDGAEWRDNGLLCEPTVVWEVLRAMDA
jgi:hypothetical protein